MTLEARFVSPLPQRLIGDRAYDSDPLDSRMRARGIELIAPHRRNRRRPPAQDGRPLRRYKRRWKIERLLAWLQNYRRILVRCDRHLETYLGLARLGSIAILIKQCS